MSTLTAILLKHLDVKSKSGFEWLCLCPYHDDKTPSFSVNIRKKVFICYACGVTGNTSQLLGHLGINEQFVQEEISLDELTGKIEAVQESVHRTDRPTVGMPVSTRFYLDADKIHDYWCRERGLSTSTVKAYELGYDTLADQAIIPVADFTGRKVGLIKRGFDPSRPRYLYSTGLKTSELLFGAHQATLLSHQNSQQNSATNGRKPQGVLVITEGAVDAMSVHNLTSVDSDGNQFWFVGVAMFGARMSRKQAQLVRKLGFSHIVIATDMDRVGRLAQAQIRTALKEVRAGAFVYDARWEESQGKDLNALFKSSVPVDAEEIQNWRNPLTVVLANALSYWTAHHLVGFFPRLEPIRNRYGKFIR